MLLIVDLTYRRSNSPIAAASVAELSPQHVRDKVKFIRDSGEAKSFR
jgi:hypothetical protein